MSSSNLGTDASGMEVIAQRGGEALVDLGDPGKGELFAIRHGVIVDQARDRVLLVRHLESLLSKSHWEPFDGDPEPVLALVRRESNRLARERFR